MKMLAGIKGHYKIDNGQGGCPCKVTGCHKLVACEIDTHFGIFANDRGSLVHEFFADTNALKTPTKCIKRETSPVHQPFYVAVLCKDQFRKCTTECILI